MKNLGRASQNKEIRQHQQNKRTSELTNVIL